MGNKVQIPILLDNWKYTFTTYKEFQLLIVCNSTSSTISKIFRNYITMFSTTYAISWLGKLYKSI